MTFKYIKKVKTIVCQKYVVLKIKKKNAVGMTMNECFIV